MRHVVTIKFRLSRLVCRIADEMIQDYLNREPGKKTTQFEFGESWAGMSFELSDTEEAKADPNLFSRQPEQTEYIARVTLDADMLMSLEVDATNLVKIEIDREKARDQAIKSVTNTDFVNGIF